VSNALDYPEEESSLGHSADDSAPSRYEKRYFDWKYLKLSFSEKAAKICAGLYLVTFVASFQES
jgi:hypothetical protein